MVELVNRFFGMSLDFTDSDVGNTIGLADGGLLEEMLGK